MSTSHLVLTSIIYLLPAFYFFYSALEIGLRNTTNIINRSAALFVGCFAVMCVAQFLLNLFPLAHAPLFYQFIFFPFVLASTGFGMMFYFNLTKFVKRVPKAVRVIVYSLPFCLFAPLTMFTPKIIEGYVFNEGWIKPLAGPLFPCLIVFLFLYCLAEILLLLSVIRRQSGSSRRKYLTLMVCSFITLFWGFILYIIRNVLDAYHAMPEFSIHAVIFYIYAVRRIIKKYDMLPNESRKYELLFELAPFGVALLDRDANIVEINAAGRSMLPPLDGNNQKRTYSFLDTYPKEMHAQLLETHRKLFDSKQSLSNHVITKMSYHDNRPLTFMVDSQYLDVDDETLEFMILRDISAQKEAEQKISFLAYHDALTGLPNRNLFHERVNMELQKAQSNGQLLAVMLMDLDRFKIVNDSLGHQVGDRLLQYIAGLLKEPFHEGSTVARIGGDEFLILLPNLTSKEAGVGIAGDLINRFQYASYKEDGLELSITASIGISFYPDDGEDVHSLIKSADISMYRAKEQGRNQLEAYQASMSHKADERLAMERNLRKAIEQNELVLYYQPQVDLATGQVCGMEALVRWNSPSKGMIPPDHFIPFAEECGLIVPLGDWVLRNACLQSKRWQEQGLPSLKVAVNISALQFHQNCFGDKVQDILQETGLDPSCLCLEITESVAVQNEEKAIALLEQLSAMGISIALDDFGTGYSSLSLLNKLPIHQIKIDKSFIGDKSPQGAQIAKSIITLSRSLNMSVLAEGVETMEQYKFLVEHSCDSIQGFLVSRPIAPEEFEAWLGDRSVL